MKRKAEGRSGGEGGREEWESAYLWTNSVIEADPCPPSPAALPALVPSCAGSGGEATVGAEGAEAMPHSASFSASTWGVPETGGTVRGSRRESSGRAGRESHVAALQGVTW